MDKIRDLLAKPLITAALGFVLGLVIGLPILGWGLFPVKWTEAAPEHLRQDVKEDYMRMAIQSYSINKDANLALTRFQELGDDAQDMLAKVGTDPKLNPNDVKAFAVAVQLPGAVQAASQPDATLPAVSAEVTPQADATGSAATEVAPAAAPAAEAEKPGTSPFLLLGLSCLLMLVIAGALAYVLVIRKNKGGTVLGSSKQAAGPRDASQQEYFDGQEAPIAQFMTTYMLGDDLYDDSFSIDSPTGEFLGECGVGISDMIGVGDPKKVTAFEVWLFDKNDIQTVTKVLMSEHAFTDPAIRQRLASKGESVLIKPNERVVLETATLQLEARIVDVNYGQGALPQNSFFERMTLELAIWPKVS